ncbi:MAG: cyclic pyranopterin monophosphate synthase MoaC [Lachnospiraceae bacterium]|nr:cyclic pyranopterin monophosphate synthase MoaC [Lachnospiraceae bacterium]
MSREKSGFTHVNEMGQANMVDVGDKSDTKRFAVASGRISLTGELIEEIKGSGGKNPKGDVLAAARIAGIMAAKKTPELIPLCHTLLLDRVSIDFEIKDQALICTCRVSLTGKTGAEMEALTGVSVALLTIYDMCKAACKGMIISDVKLLEKDGGKSGHYTFKG